MSEIAFKTTSHPLPLPSNIGSLFLRASIYSEGRDFTNAWAKDKDYSGHSVLKKIWEGKSSLLVDHHDEAVVVSIWKNSELKGVLLWLRPKDGSFNVPEVPERSNTKPKAEIPVMNLGSLMTFLNPELRGNGYVKEAMKILEKEIHVRANAAIKRNMFPFICASDACLNIADQVLDVPLISSFSSNPTQLSMDFRNQVWKFWKHKDFARNEDAPWIKYLVKPLDTQKLPPPRMKMR